MFQGGRCGLIVLRHTASLFCHQRGSQSSYGPLDSSYGIEFSRLSRFRARRGQIRSIFVLFCKNAPFAIKQCRFFEKKIRKQKGKAAIANRYRLQSRATEVWTCGANGWPMGTNRGQYISMYVVLSVCYWPFWPLLAIFE